MILLSPLLPARLCLSLVDSQMSRTGIEHAEGVPVDKRPGICSSVFDHHPLDTTTQNRLTNNGRVLRESVELEPRESLERG
jgi:hypothetical protein